MEKPRQLMDRATGQVWYALVPVERVVPARGGQFFMAQMAAFEHLAMHPLPARAMRVFCYLLAHLDADNWLHVEQSHLVAALNMAQGHVSAALRRLVQEGLIDAGPTAGRTRTYRLNPYVGWRGKAAGRRKALAEAARRWGMGSG